MTSLPLPESLSDDLPRPGQAAPPPARLAIMVADGTALLLIADLVETLLDRGHEVHVGVERMKEPAVAHPLSGWMGRPGFTVGLLPVRADHWSSLLRSIRRAEAEDGVEAAGKARPTITVADGADLADTGEAASSVATPDPAKGSRLYQILSFGAALPGGKGMRTGLLARLERGVPIDPVVRTYVEQVAPDVVIATDDDLSSPQAEYLRTAAALGMPAVALGGVARRLSAEGAGAPLPAFGRRPVERCDIGGLAIGPATGVGRADKKATTAWALRIGLPAGARPILWAMPPGKVMPAHVERLKAFVAALRAQPTPLGQSPMVVAPSTVDLTMLREADLGEGVFTLDPADRAGLGTAFLASGAVISADPAAMIRAIGVGTPAFCLRGATPEDRQFLTDISRSGAVQTFSDDAKSFNALGRALGGRRGRAAGESGAPAIADYLEAVAAAGRPAAQGGRMGAFLLRQAMRPVAWRQWLRRARGR